MVKVNAFVNVKSIGKRKPIFSAVPYVLPGDVATLRDLIVAIVENEIKLFNSKKSDAMLLPFLTQEQIDDQSVSGKVSFGNIYSENKADLEKAIVTALQGFEDGLFRVLVNDVEIDLLDAPITIKDGDTLTFIRLIFLSGSVFY